MRAGSGQHPEAQGITTLLTASGCRPMKFLIADDYPIIRVGICRLITQEWPSAQIEEAETLEEAVQKFHDFLPDAVVLDFVMPDVDGAEGVVRMLRAAGSTPILVLSNNTDSANASRFLTMGVAGFLPMDQPSTELVVALRRLVQGKRYVTPDMADRLVDALGNHSAPGDLHHLLSIQEYRVMLLIAAGKTPAEIAKTMFLSAKTVGTYRARILEKTGWKNNIQLTKYCVERQLTGKS